MSLQNSTPFSCKTILVRRAYGHRCVLYNLTFKTVFEKVVRTEELENGYPFGFPGSTEWAGKLLEIVDAERACSPFLAFALFFEPEWWPHLAARKGTGGHEGFRRDGTAGGRRGKSG